jgi:hypothetical protein
MSCKHWFEDDGEYCTKARRMTGCAGVKSQCRFGHYKEKERKTSLCQTRKN